MGISDSEAGAPSVDPGIVVSDPALAFSRLVTVDSASDNIDRAFVDS